METNKSEMEKSIDFGKVINEAVKMWFTNYKNGNLKEPFEKWCRNGDVFFYNDYCKTIMKKIAPIIDSISCTIQDELEKEKTEHYFDILDNCRKLCGRRFSLKDLNKKLNKMFEVNGSLHFSKEQASIDYVLVYEIDDDRAFDIYCLKDRKGDDIYITEIDNLIY